MVSKNIKQVFLSNIAIAKLGKSRQALLSLPQIILSYLQLQLSYLQFLTFISTNTGIRMVSSGYLPNFAFVYDTFSCHIHAHHRVRCFRHADAARPSRKEGTIRSRHFLHRCYPTLFRTWHLL